MRALVVGYGRMGGFHRRALLDLGYEVTTVDPDAARRADFASLSSAGRLYDVAAISCPVEYLRENAESLRGVPMLVEKPFAPTYADALALADALDGTPVAVGFVERFNPHVRALKRWVGGLDVTRARFIRWSDRPSFNAALDLTIHDVDLAHFLGIEDVAEYDTRIEQPEKLRRILIDHRDVHGVTRNISADFVDHVQSPLHALWHSFLMGGAYPKPDDALRALEVVERMVNSPAATAA